MNFRRNDDFIIRKSVFVFLKTKSKVRDDYEFIKELGSGSFGVVFLARNKITGEKRAIKAISKDRIVDEETFSNEITILKTLDHPNIVKLYEVYESDSSVYLIMELCEGKELFEYLVKKRSLSENEAAKVMRKVLSAIAYCHEKNICHRDLKPENILLKYDNDIDSVKLIDFGLSTRIHNHEQLTSANGTPLYVAPEVIEKKYSKEIDNWSLGVILYFLLCGSPPFYGKTLKDTLALIKKGIYSFSHKAFQKCSTEVKDLISKLLVKDPKKRYSAIQAYNHSWIRRQVDAESIDLQLQTSVFEGIEKVLETHTLKKTVFLYIATQVPEQEIQNLKNIFQKIDTNGNGLLSKQEMLLGIKEIGIQVPMMKMAQIFDAIDVDKSGQIDYTEFIATFLDNIVYKNEKYLKLAFERFDLDKSGKINKAELRSLFGGGTIPLNNANLDEMIKFADKNNDGEIDYNEFIKVMREFNQKELKE